ncbi:hypothetical protein ACWT_4715 [Actinoplanes sp. SE50]|uniref:hypothetical protein n=1 Tax=unclassified Actinoplanes TaxID=2626549 RepID=UPI00023EBF4C|nr:MULTISPECIES: hypothetical protein [unclassified Actinoplanes]AEV85737.1 hypothetical protein ACPL_4846 [Actinoplanes sp. SE50/110]ATO84130.1 hypothetical protein ACWT_4715 [Actinoplanes sp. SE50]SLM01540.1 hypothetical protein ACSP50_4776 [Actinoplanes sp. SE50/110]
MLFHPFMMLGLARERRHELIAEADRERLLAAARRSRRAGKRGAVRGRPAGTLSACEPSVAVPAR